MLLKKQIKETKKMIKTTKGFLGKAKDDKDKKVLEFMLKQDESLLRNLKKEMKKVRSKKSKSKKEKTNKISLEDMLHELHGECDSRAYQFKISFDQNMGIQIDIFTKYIPDGSGIKDLYHDDWCKSYKKLLKKALHWINKEDNFRG